jgi:hypothetical protein
MRLPILLAAISVSIPATLLRAQVPNRPRGRPADRPPELIRLIQAVEPVGLLRPAAFVDTTPPDFKSPNLRRQLDSGFLAFPTGAASALLTSKQLVFAADSETSFSISAYSNQNRLQVVHVFAPLVNGSERQNQQMMASLDSVARVLASDTTGLFAWIDSSWKAVWRDWEHSRTRADRVKERRFGQFLIAISGVPPDFVFLGAVRVH